jgi:chromosome segregation ATPase
MFVALEASERYADSMVYVKIKAISVLKQRLRYIERQLGLSMASDSLFQESVDMLYVTREQLEAERGDLLSRVETLNSEIETITKNRDRLKRRRNFWRVVGVAETFLIAAFVIVKVG